MRVIWGVAVMTYLSDGESIPVNAGGACNFPN